MQVVRPLQDGDFVRIKMFSLESCQPRVLTLKMDVKWCVGAGFYACDRIMLWQAGAAVGHGQKCLHGNLYGRSCSATKSSTGRNTTGKMRR